MGATCLMSEKICCIAGDVPTRFPSTPRKTQIMLEFFSLLEASVVANRTFQKGDESSWLDRLLQEPEGL